MTSFVVDTSEGAWARHLCAGTATAKQRILSTRLCSQKPHFGPRILSECLINAKRLRPTIGGAFRITMSRTPSAISTLDPTTTTFTLRHQGKVFTCCSSGLQKEQSNLSPKGFHPCPKTMLGKEVTIQSVETVPRLLQISPRWQSTVVVLCHTNRTAVFQGCVSRRKF